MFQLIFEFPTPSELGKPGAGFSLGHLTVIGESGAVSSKGRFPDKSMMLFVSVCDLLDGIRNLLTSPKKSVYEFIGADSSFRIVFEKTSPECISVIADDSVITRVNPQSLAREILSSVAAFYSDAVSKLSTGDPVFEDLRRALEDYQEFVKRFQCH